MEVLLCFATGQMPVAWLLGGSAYPLGRLCYRLHHFPTVSLVEPELFGVR